ncbi:MAG: hypothetical protein ACM3X9_08455 [Bacillota bacterium]
MDDLKKAITPDLREQLKILSEGLQILAETVEKDFRELEQKFQHCKELKPTSEL